MARHIAPLRAFRPYILSVLVSLLASSWFFPIMASASPSALPDVSPSTTPAAAKPVPQFKTPQEVRFLGKEEEKNILLLICSFGGYEQPLSGKKHHVSLRVRGCVT